MRTVIVRLVEPELAGGQLRGLVEAAGSAPVPFDDRDALLAVLQRVGGQDREEARDGGNA